MKKYLGFKNLVLLIVLCFVFPLFPQEVDNFGMLRYSYPLKVPVGRNGLQPEISLDYHSGSKNGILGQGFSLGGISAITRDPDYPINWDMDDHFLYNGEKMIWDVDLECYRVESDSKIRIIKFMLGNFISAWSVIDRDGNRMDYGGVGLSNAFVPSSVSSDYRAHTWSISAIYDLNNNAIYFYYHIDNYGMNYLHYIKYSSLRSEKDNKLYSFRVYFSYEKRPDHIEQFNPSRRYIQFRLGWISVVKTIDNDFELIRRYDIHYKQSEISNQSRIFKVGELRSGYHPLVIFDSTGYPTPNYWDNNYYLPSPVYSWNIEKVDFSEAQNPLNSLETLFKSNNNYIPLVGDFNADGRDDIFRASSTANKVNLWIGQDSGFENIGLVINSPLVGTANEYIPMSADFNGDGRSDIIRSGRESIYLWTADLSGVSFIEKGKIIDYPGNGTGFEYDTILGDFNGDGKSDIFISSNNSSRNRLFLSDNGDSSFRLVPVGFSDPMNGTSNNYKVIVGDFNGDGLDDLVRTSSAESATYLFLAKYSGGFSKEGVVLSQPTNGTDNNYRCIIADFNGDGRSEFIRTSSSNSDSNVFYYSESTGRFFSPGGSIAEATNGTSKYFEPLIGDFNGDGLPDIFKAAWNTTISPFNNLIYLTKPNGYSFRKIMRCKGIPLSSEGLKPIVGDFNGDGKTDILRAGEFFDGLETTTLLYGQGQKLNELHSIFMHSAKIRFSYSSLAQMKGNFKSNLYSAINPSDNAYQNISHPNNYSVVNHISIDDGRGTVTVTDYFYHNLRYRNSQKSDSENLGFEYIIRCEHDGSFNKTVFSQNYDMGLNQRPVRMSEYDQNGNLILAKNLIYSSHFNDFSQTVGNPWWQSYNPISFVNLLEIRITEYNEINSKNNSEEKFINKWITYNYVEDISSPYYGEIESISNWGHVVGFSSEEDLDFDKSVIIFDYSFSYRSDWGFQGEVTPIVRLQKKSTYTYLLDSVTWSLTQQEKYYYYKNIESYFTSPHFSQIN
jgi:hypothetical protein